MNNKHWREFVKFVLMTIIMLILELICGKFRNNGDNSD